MSRIKQQAIPINTSITPSVISHQLFLHSIHSPDFFITRFEAVDQYTVEIWIFVVLAGLIALTLVLAAAALLHSATNETYTVLGTSGWSIPTTGNDSVYLTWAADKEFKVEDNLVFDFPTGAHDVTEVTKANYDSCRKTNPISTVTTGPANVSLTTTGMHYFICTFGQHCTVGQKLAVNVIANDDSNNRTPPAATISPPGTRTPVATPPSSTSSTTPTTTTTSSPPSPSSASSITFGGFSVAILSTVLIILH